MNLLRILSGIITCVVAFQATAQVSLFNKMYDDFNAWEVVREIYEQPDSSILISSSAIDFFATDSTMYRRFYLSKLSQNGIVLSRKIISIPQYEVGSSFQLGLFYGQLLNTIGYSSIDTNNLIRNLAKGFYINNLADTTGSFTIQFKSFPNCNPVYRLMTTTPKGTFVSVANYNYAFADSIFMFSSDTNGNILWVKEHPNIRMNITGIVETEDKGFLLSGKQDEKGIYKRAPDGGDMWVGHPERLWYAKTDSVGNLVWEKLVTGGYYELYDTIYHKYKLDVKTTFRSSIKTLDGNYVMAGYIAGQPYMIKINEQGERLWQSKYFNTLSYLDTLQRKGYFYDVKEANGYLYAFGGLDSLETGQQYPTPFYFLMKLTGTGRTIWTRYFKRVSGDDLYSVTPGKGCFYLIGSKRDTTPDKYGNQDGWIVKVDEYGCQIPGCHLNDVIDTSTAISEVREPAGDFILFPNPVSHILKIQSNGMSKNISYSIYNYSGQQVLSGCLSTSMSVSVQSVPTGLYIIEIKDDSGTVLRKKILKE